jgi:hypothetical protein
VFIVKEETLALSTIRQKSFHRTVVRLLYLAKHTRPDILVVVGFLCRRIKEPTVEDVKKSAHWLEYLEGLMVLKPRHSFGLEVYINARFTAHSEGIYHS